MPIPVETFISDGDYPDTYIIAHVVAYDTERGFNVPSDAEMQKIARAMVARKPLRDRAVIARLESLLGYDE